MGGTAPATELPGHVCVTAEEQFQAAVAKTALLVAQRYGFARRRPRPHRPRHRAPPTEDIDPFTDRDGAVQAAVSLVADGMRQDGYTVDIERHDSDLAEIIYGMDVDMVELRVARGDHTVRLTLAHFGRHQPSVTMNVGPVLHIDDVVGSKVAAMATRAEPRDYIDVAGALHRYTRDELIQLARTSDPALTEDEIADAMRRLDRIPDAAWKRYGLTDDECRTVREQFAAWPRR